ncbi:hypothetical protein ACVNP1_00990 [Staphylococcus aureus]
MVINQADYTQRVIDILKKHGVEHQYRVMSLDYDVMTKLKRSAISQVWLYHSVAVWSF